MINIKQIADQITSQIQALKTESENEVTYFKGAIDGVKKLMDELDAAVSKAQADEASTPKE